MVLIAFGSHNLEQGHGLNGIFSFGSEIEIVIYRKDVAMPVEMGEQVVDLAG